MLAYILTQILTNDAYTRAGRRSELLDAPLWVPAAAAAIVAAVLACCVLLG